MSEIYGAVLLAQPGLTGRQADEIQINFKVSKFTLHRNIQLFALFNQGTVSLEQY